MMTSDPDLRTIAARQDNLDPQLFGQTPSQTIGPFFHYGLPWKGGADLVGHSAMGARTELFPQEHDLLHLTAPKGTPLGEVIEIAGCVVDGAGNPVPDAMIEIWQANASGRYRSEDDPREMPGIDPEFVGFGRAATDESGIYRFRTIMPGRVPGPGNALQAPHVAVSVFGRGLLKRLATRIYFAGAEGNDTDLTLELVAPERRNTLIAQHRDGTWWFDIVLQGERETVFFAL